MPIHYIIILTKMQVQIITFCKKIVKNFPIPYSPLESVQQRDYHITCTFVFYIGGIYK